MIVTTVADDADGTAAAAATVVTSCHYRTGLTRLLLLLLGHTFKRGRRLTFPKHASFVDFRSYFFVGYCTFGRNFQLRLFTLTHRTHTTQFGFRFVSSV